MVRYKSIVVTCFLPVNRTCVTLRFIARSSVLVRFGTKSESVDSMECNPFKYILTSSPINTASTPKEIKHFLKGGCEINANKRCSSVTYSCLRDLACSIACSMIFSISGEVLIEFSF